MTTSKEILLETLTAIFYMDGTSVDKNLETPVVDAEENTMCNVSFENKEVELAGYDGCSANPKPFYIENGTKEYIAEFDGVIEF